MNLSAKISKNNIRFYSNSKIDKEKMFIFDHGQINWKTSSRGGLCADEGGIYEGLLSSQKFKEIFELTKKIKIGQPKKYNERIDLGSARSKVILTSNGDVESFYLINNVDGLDKWHRQAALVKSTLRPKSVVKMSTKKKNNEIEVRFELIGDLPQKLLFSKLASENFSINTPGKITYFKQYKSAIILHQKRRMIKLRLLLDKIPEDLELKYTNRKVLHHAKKKGDTFLLNLCSQL